MPESEATCQTCPFLGPRGSVYDSSDGHWHPAAHTCRFGPPVWHAVDPEKDWCGRHPERCPQMESVLSEMPAPLSEFDVLRIIGDWKAEQDRKRMEKARAGIRGKV